MASQTQSQQSAIHLETIYEESDHSFSSSTVNIHPNSGSMRRKFSPSYRIDGLISARSIPPVDIHRRRRYRRVTTNDTKPPIEVQFRDGSKRYIHPSASNISNSSPINRSGIQTKKKYSHSNNSKINGKYRQVLSSLPSETTTTTTMMTTTKKHINRTLTKKSDIKLTIITAAELRQAGISPPLTSSPDESETVTITKSPSNSSIDTLHTMNDISFKESHEVSQRYQSEERVNIQAPQQSSSSRSQSLPSSTVQQKSIINTMPPVAVIPPSSKRTIPSLEITLTKEENDKYLTSNRSTVFNQTLNVTNVHQQTQIQPNSNSSIEPKAKILVGGSRSAFRPFHKQTSNNSSTTTTMTRIIPTNTVKPTVQTNKIPLTSKVFVMNSTSIHLPVQPSTNKINHQAIQRDPRSISSNHHSQVKLSDKSISISSQPKQNSSRENLSDLIDPKLQWHSVTSKSLYDVPRLSHQYADIPLRITIPFSAPNQNQKLVHKHDPILERRLFDAGLSPETIALYERVLEVADPQSIYPSEILNHYSQQ